MESRNMKLKIQNLLKQINHYYQMDTNNLRQETQFVIKGDWQLKKYEEFEMEHKLNNNRENRNMEE